MLEFNNKNNLIIIFVILAIVMFFTQGIDLKETLLCLPRINYCSFSTWVCSCMDGSKTRRQYSKSSRKIKY